MKRMQTHPLTEKLQVKFHNMDYPPGDVKDVKKTVSFSNLGSDLTALRKDFKIRDEGNDLYREFEVEYEQFITNISRHMTKGTRS